MKSKIKNTKNRRRAGRTRALALGSGSASLSKSNIGYKHPRYMIGTTALHKLGDISRPDGDLCLIHARAGQDYIGNWVTGFGFVEVRFPVETTRRLTPTEKSQWNGKRIGINGSWSYNLKIR
jgi:hypothetical protein